LLLRQRRIHFIQSHRIQRLPLFCSPAESLQAASNLFVFLAFGRAVGLV
jgi:hypothetical protein